VGRIQPALQILERKLDDPQLTRVKYPYPPLSILMQNIDST
jgi:hypothetical protein